MNNSYRLWFALCLLGLVYSCVALSNISIAYLDFGDGNYLYISSRLADGLLLYRDILAPQPPLHLLTGMCLIRFARLFSDNPESWLYFVRGFSLLLHLATMTLLALLTRRLFRSNIVAGLAALFYLIIPIGFWWTLCYQSEPLMLIFLLGGFHCMLRWNRRGMLLGGALHLLAVLTNMTAAPYICWIALLLLFIDRKQLLAYILPCAGGWLIVVGVFHLLGSDYLGNVFLNQTGTFPKAEILALNPDGPQTLLQYVIFKVRREGLKILQLDFFYLVWGCLGLALYFERGWVRKGFFCETTAEPDTNEQARGQTADDREPECPRTRAFTFFVGSFVFWTWMSLGFVSKGATEDYIFTIGEPLLCVFCAAGIVWIYRYCLSLLDDPRRGQWPCYLFALLFLGTIWLQTFGLKINTANGRLVFAGGQIMLLRTLSEEQFELPALQVSSIARLIEQHSQPGDLLLGPPHYAFVTRRALAEEYAEIFIWRIKYLNEKIVDRRDGEGVNKVRRIAALLHAKKIAVALIDSQLAGIEEIAAELQQNYQQLHAFNSLNTPIYVFIPRK